MSQHPSPRATVRGGGPDEGWYPDPARDRDTFRWWTGVGWSRWLSTDPDAAPPSDAHSVSLEVARPDPSVRTPHRIRSAMMLVVALIVLLSAAVLVGWDRRQPVALANPAPSASFVPPEVGRQIEERAVTINGEVRLDYDPAFEMDPENSIDGVAALCVLATDRGGRGEAAWRSYAIIGLAEDELNDLELRASAESAMAKMVTAMNDAGTQDPPLQDLAWQPRPDLGPDGTAGELTGRIRGSFDEDLRIIVVDLDHRRRVMYAESAKPNIGRDGQDALARTRDSLRRL